SSPVRPGPGRNNTHPRGGQGANDMTARDAMAELEKLCKLYDSTKHLKEVLETAAGAEQVAAEAKARFDAAEREHESLTEATRREHAEFETWKKETAKVKYDQAANHAIERRAYEATIASLAAEIASLSNQRNALAEAVAQLRGSVAGI